jgi:hypothetical protein
VRNRGVTGFLAAVVVLLVACDAQPEKPAKSSNAKVEVQILTRTEDGCTIYRFYDGGDKVYFVRCNGYTAASWDTTVMAGESATVVTHHHVQTLGR